MVQSKKASSHNSKDLKDLKEVSGGYMAVDRDLAFERNRSVIQAITTSFSKASKQNKSIAPKNSK